MSHPLSLLNAEAKHKEFVYDKFKDKIELLERNTELFFYCLDEAKEHLTKNEDENYHHAFAKMAMKINSDIIRVIFHAVFNGWYGTGYSLIRELNDALIKIMFISYFPNESIKIVNDTINSDTARKRLKDIQIDMLLDYKSRGIISGLKHADSEFIWMYGENTGEIIKFRFYPNPNDDNIEFLLTIASGFLNEVVRYFRKYYLEKYGDKFIDQSFNSSFIHLEKITSEAINEMNEKF